MSTNPYQDIAKEFLDLWQKQMTSVMSDKQFIHAMLELFQNMQAKPNAQPPPTTTNSTNASATEHVLLDQLAFRVAMCEKRLAALEIKKSDTKPAVRKSPGRNSARSKKPHK